MSRLTVYGFLLAFIGSPVAAHDDYKDWVNKYNQGCCNNHDCRVLYEEEQRTHNGELQVIVEGNWCPILAFHYLLRGNVANPLYAHVCVRPKALYNETLQPCQRILCYQPQPQS